MYHFVKAICLARSIGSQWKEVDLSQIVVFDIYTTYSKIYLVLTNDVLNEEVYVDLDTLRIEFSSYNDTLTNLLLSLGNRSLNTVPTIPSTTVKFAKYSDAIRSQYKINLTKAGYSLPDNYPLSNMDDLAITRPMYSTNMQMLHDYCMISVNGYYHMTDSDGEQAFVYDGGKTMRKSRHNDLGILSFLDIGKLTKVKLDPAKILSQDIDSTLKEKIYFSIDEDITNKTCFLVLGGYLVFPDENTFWQNGDKSFVLNINNIPYLERLHDSRLSLDLSSLEFIVNPINPDLLDIDQIYSDAFIRNYMTLSQSYLVIVDTPNLITNKIYIRHSSLPGMFTSYIDPKYPLIVNYGKVAEYWKTEEDGFWSVTVTDSFYRDYLFSQQPAHELEAVSNNRIPMRSFQHSKGFLLEIAGYK